MLCFRDIKVTTLPSFFMTGIKTGGPWATTLTFTFTVASPWLQGSRSLNKDYTLYNYACNLILKNFSTNSNV